MKNKFVAALGSAALCTAAAAGAIALAPAASAADTADRCTARGSNFTLYEHDNYCGTYKSFGGTVRELGPTNMQNRASSMKNRTSRHIGLYNLGTSCSGDHYLVQPNSSDTDFSNNNFDNKASCVLFL